MGLIADKLFYRILAMSLDKKIVLDQNVHDLLPILGEVGARKVYDIGKLGFDPNAETEDSEIHRRLKLAGAKTPNSGILFITNNRKHFKKPEGYDILWVPNKFNIKDLCETIKLWLYAQPKEPQNKIFVATKMNLKYAAPYHIREYAKGDERN
jgi:hypothetical protein